MDILDKQKCLCDNLLLQRGWQLEDPQNKLASNVKMENVKQFLIISFYAFLHQEKHLLSFENKTTNSLYWLGFFVSFCCSL